MLENVKHELVAAGCQILTNNDAFKPLTTLTIATSTGAQPPGTCAVWQRMHSACWKINRQTAF